MTRHIIRNKRERKDSVVLQKHNMEIENQTDRKFLKKGVLNLIEEWDFPVRSRFYKC